MSLLSLGLRVLAILGLGMAPLVDQSLAIPGLGELPQGTGTTAREFSLVGALYDNDPDGRGLQSIRDDLIDAVKPDLVTYDQPLILRYQACDEDGDPISDSLDIICKYTGGLEGNWDNHQQERVVLNFKQHLPYIRNTYDSGVQLNFTETVGDADYILMRQANGAWLEMANGADNTVRAIAIGKDGYIYVGGLFSSMGGVANTSYIARWDGTTWTAMGTGCAASGAGAGVYAIAIGPDGSVYIGGFFNSVGGVANTRHIAKWNGAAWVSIAAVGANAEVNALVIQGDYLYAGGNFTLIGGESANYISIMRLDTPSTWYAIGGALNGLVNAMAPGIDGNTVYLGGQFTTAGALSTPYVTSLLEDPTTGAFYYGPLGIGANNYVMSLAVTPDGKLYAAGVFTSMGGIPNTEYIAVWNGTTWGFVQAGGNALVQTLFVASDGQLYAGGQFTQIGELFNLGQVAVWNGSTWVPFSIDLPGNPIIYALNLDPVTGILYIGFNTSGNAVMPPVTTATIGSATTYPVFTMVGPGKLDYIKNNTTGRALYFEFTLQAGEGAVLSLDPMNPYFISSSQGNVFRTILPGSNTKFPLMPGINNLSSSISGPITAATQLFLFWRDQYWSLDGAAWK